MQLHQRSRDKLEKRYITNFVDNSSYYVEIYLTKKTWKRSRRLRICLFLVFFEKQYNCRIQVLRTDSRSEYMNVGEFLGYANTQASNGKAKGMHRTILNMARCMLFASGLPLIFACA